MASRAAPRARISVVIPMRNEARHIGACLEALVGQDYPAERFEIVVADGDSTDGSAGIVRSFAERHANVRLCRNERRATPFGLNEGIRRSSGEVIVILGARTVVEPGFLRGSLSALERSKADVAGGVIEPVGEDPFGRAVAAAVTSRFGVGSIAHRQAEREGFVDTVAFAAYRRDVFERLGLFDEEMIRDQDDELNYRVRKHGGRIFLTPEVRTRYFSRASPLGLWRQYFDYGYWKVRVLQKHPRTMRPRHFVPAASVALGAALLAAGAFDVRPLAAGVALALVYGALVAATALRISRRLGRGDLPALLAAFPILHLSYGIGFLIGLVRFLPRWWSAEPPPPRLAGAE